MEIIKTKYPINKDITDSLWTGDAITTTIINHIYDNIDMYKDFDVNILDFTIFDNMQKYAGGVNYSQEVQDTIDEARVGISNPVYIVNFDNLDCFYDFGDDSLVFSPESSYTLKNFIGIPRTTVASDIDGDVVKDLLFSFKGANWTHSIRKTIIDLYPNECEGYSGWGVDNNDIEFRSNYIKTIKRSKFSLCPRGYGRTSYRLYESMMVGTIPVIISDDWQPPLSFMLDWNEFSVTINEADVDKIPEILNSFSDEDVLKMSERAKEVFYTYFNSDNMYKCVYLYLKEFCY